MGSGQAERVARWPEPAGSGNDRLEEDRLVTFHEWHETGIFFHINDENVLARILPRTLQNFVRPESSPSHLLDHGIILRVRTDPESYGCVFLNIAQGAPMNSDPDRVDRLA